MYQNLHKYVFFALVLFAFIVKAQDRPNISYNDLLLKSENDFGLITEARLAAANFGLPFSIYTKDGYFIDAVGVENGMPVYAVITKVHDPINNGYTAFWHQISAEINLNDARMHYTDGRITNPGLGYSVSNLKSEGGMLLVMESTGKRTLGLDPYSGDLVDPEVTLSDASNLTTPIQTRTSPWGFYSISDQIKDGVMAYDTAGVFSSFFAPAGGVNNDILNNVRGHNYHPVTGNLLVTNGSAPVDDLIQEFDNMGNFIGSFITPTTGGVDSPFDIIFRASDALASGSSSNAVHRYDFDGNLLGYFVTSISFPEQISEQTDGNVAVAGFSPPSGLYVYDANGTQIKFLTGVTGLRGCFQLGNGNYIVTNGAGVHEIDSESGVLIRTVVAGVSGRYATLSGPAGTPPNVWNLTLSVLDAGGAKSDIDLQIGQHPNATDGIDSELGEIELPPVPPAGAFDARLNLPVTPPASSLIDIRNSELTEAEWTFQFQPGVSGYPFTFNWNPESLPDGSFYLTDAFGGIFVNVNMKSTNTFSLTNSAVTSLKIEFTSALESTFNTADGWNIISVPLAMADMSVATLFPAAVTSAFGFDNGYVVVDNLINGAGYWLKFSEADEHTFTGQAFVGNVSVSEGWNMVGPFNVETPVSAVISDPPGLIASSFFGFDNGYVVPENLMPGHGYWVKASGNGELIMNTPVKDGEKGVNEAAMYEIAFNVVDGVGGTYNMAAGIDPLGTDGLDAGLGEAELPPAPPAGIFDARFVFPDNVTGSLKDYRMGAQVYQGTVSHKINFQLGTGSTGLTLNFTIPEIMGSVSVNLKDPFGGVLFNQTYNTFNTPISYTVTNTALTSVLVTITYDIEVPVELTSFAAAVSGETVELQWETATETNNQGFQIERSLSGAEGWSVIGYVEGKGTTTEISKYQFVDRTPVSGTSYYRLRQIDFGGAFEYSSAVEVEFVPTQYSLGQNYPNPFNPTTKIKFAVPVDAKVVVKVYNTIGQEVAEAVNGSFSAGLYEVSFNASDLTSGVYFYTIDAKGIDGTTHSDVKKMVLMR